MSILRKYRDEIVKRSLRLSAYLMEGRVKILEEYPKSEEIISFLSHIDFQTIVAIYVEQKCHVLDTTLYGLFLTLKHI